jgi:hypothetical protein
MLETITQIILLPITESQACANVIAELKGGAESTISVDMCI